MGRLRLCIPDATTEDQPDSLPFPSVWSEMQQEPRHDDEAAVAEIERALEILQRQVDALQDEVDAALHLPDASGSDWPPRAA